MQIQRLRDQLIIDEGIRYKIYLDSLGLPTCGIGHLITKNDEEYKKPTGTPITQERAFSLFEKDIKIVLDDCQKLFKDFQKFPEELQEIIANMMFNLGLSRLRQFQGFINAINHKDAKTAAECMKDSLWFKQVGIRAKRLYDRMIALANCNVEYSK